MTLASALLQSVAMKQPVAMKRRKIEAALALLIALTGFIPGGVSQLPAPSNKASGRHAMHATGTFDVKVAPADMTDAGKAGDLGRMSIDKVWTGDVQGTSKGEMLTGITQETGSMAYVAVERVTAKVGRRSGTFVFVHRATMLRADPKAAVLDITVVPQSGTGELAGLSGSLLIDQSSGVHKYDFTYELP